MAAKWVDLLRTRVGRNPSIAQAITRPNVSFLHTPAGLIRLRDSGGQSPSVIFACDAPNVVEHYDAVFDLLSTSYRLICLEMPGFGFSRPSSTFDFSVRQYVDTVVHTISTLQLGPTTLVFPCAWSYVAYQVAIEHPALVDRLIVSQCPRWDEELAWTRRIDVGGLMATPVVGQLLLAMAPQRMSDMWYKTACRPGLPNDNFAEPARKALSNGAIFCLASLIQAWSNTKELFAARVSQPTIVMWGGSDRSHKRSSPNSALDHLHHGKLLIYPEAGHFPELEDPQRLKDLLSNEDLWAAIKSNETSDATIKETEKARDGAAEKSTVSDAGNTTHDFKATREQRRPFDSHL